jgi:hypothetical protein
MYHVLRHSFCHSVFLYVSYGSRNTRNILFHSTGRVARDKNDVRQTERCPYKQHEGVWGIGCTYLLTPWCRVLPEQLTGLQLVKKFPAFHGTRKFSTALTSVRHLSLSWASPIQSIYPHPTSWRSIPIQSTHLLLGLPSGLFPSGFPTNTQHTPSPNPYALHAQPISFFSILSPAQYLVRNTDHVAPRYAISSIPPLLFPPRSKYSPQHLVLKHP